jgi:hypothetical protein
MAVSTLPTTAEKWTCDGCGVTASRLDGHPDVEPSCWTTSEEGRLCLACRRSRAGEAALSCAPAGTSREECRRLRRTGLIEFELGRAPDQRDTRIASACGTSPSMVDAVRRTLNAVERDIP